MAKRRQAMTDKGACDAIAEAMSGKEWTADTWEAVAFCVRATGREIKEPAREPVVHDGDFRCTLNDSETEDNCPNPPTWAGGRADWPKPGMQAYACDVCRRTADWSWRRI